MSFFADEINFEPYGPYIFDWQHILLVCVFSVIIAVSIILLYKKDRKTTDKVLIALWIIQIVLEFAKIGLAISYRGFGELRYNFMPIHLCSMYMYVFPFFMWGKGKVKHYATAFCSTYVVFGGIINFIIPAALYHTPAITSFFGLHTMLYHAIMVFSGLFICIKHYKMRKYDFLFVFLILLVTSIPAVVFDCVFGADYMFFSSGINTPLTIISNHIPYQWLWIIIMYALYLILALIMQTFVYLFTLIISKVRKKAT